MMWCRSVSISSVTTYLRATINDCLHTDVCGGACAVRACVHFVKVFLGGKLEYVLEGQKLNTSLLNTTDAADDMNTQ